MKFTIAKNDLNDLLVFSFFYALGRTIAAPSRVAEMIVAHSNVLDIEDRELMIRAITDALDHDRAGMECDRIVWSNLREFLKDGKPQMKGVPV